jgi:hypothetical protein
MEQIIKLIYESVLLGISTISGSDIPPEENKPVLRQNTESISEDYENFLDIRLGCEVYERSISGNIDFYVRCNGYEFVTKYQDKINYYIQTRKPTKKQTVVVEDKPEVVAITEEKVQPDYCAYSTPQSAMQNQHNISDFEWYIPEEGEPTSGVYAQNLEEITIAINNNCND